MSKLHKFFATLFSFLFLGCLSVFVLVGLVFGYFSHDLPDYSQLEHYQLPTMTRVYSSTGELLAQYATTPRIFIPISEIPQRVVNGFIAAEDQHFYSHHGIDPLALTRALITDVYLLLKHRRPIGASTITQQVARNFFLNDDLSMSRKIKEALLALRIDNALSKDRIMELYLNDIYFGRGAYGIAAAALNYFGKAVDDLTPDEIAYLASLPKGPNNYNPEKHYAAAVRRRNWILDRMSDLGFISVDDATIAKKNQLVTVSNVSNLALVRADYYLAAVRAELVKRFGGDQNLMDGGLYVRTSLDPALQKMADDALRAGILAYDRRHGYHGTIKHYDQVTSETMQDFTTMPLPNGSNSDWRLSLVSKVSKDSATVLLQDGTLGTIPLSSMSWARKILPNQRVGGSVKSVASVLNVGDVVLVSQKNKNVYQLEQLPLVQGAIVAMDPQTGRVLALSGGWDFAYSQFNRAIQANRQPGSSIKPFVYMSALDNGYTPATMILDAPIVIDQGVGQKRWKPKNFTGKFLGLQPMRRGIEESKNLMTIRLAQAVGIDKVADYIKRFGVMDHVPLQLSIVLGAGDTTLMRMVTAYAMIDNGGKRVSPSLIDLVEDRKGSVLFKHDTSLCDACQVEDASMDAQKIPTITDTRTSVVSEQTAYQMVTLLEGVIQNGTGQEMRSIGKPLAGKTGTTSDNRDAWFVGFSPNLVVGVYMGFDQVRTLGRQVWGGQETGASVAGPVFKSFMINYMKDKPALPFPTPPGIRMIYIDEDTGLPATASTKRKVLDAFKPGTEPKANQQQVISNGNDSSMMSDLKKEDANVAAEVAGGLY